MMDNTVTKLKHSLYLILLAFICLSGCSTTILLVSAIYLNIPLYVLIPIIFLGTVLIAFFLYQFADTKLLQPIALIFHGIQQLTTEPPATIPTPGIYSEPLTHLNQIATIITDKTAQIQDLKRYEKERTIALYRELQPPIQMIIDRSLKLENDLSLPPIIVNQVKLIRQQGKRLDLLAENIYLSYQIDRGVHPLKEDFYLVPALRKIMIDFLNADLYDRYPIEWEIQESLTPYKITGDQMLFIHAMTCLIRNCQNRTPTDCTTYVKMEFLQKYCYISIDDNGPAIDTTLLEELQHETYQEMDLYLATRIILLHNGIFTFAHSPLGGLSVSILLPLLAQ